MAETTPDPESPTPGADVAPDGDSAAMAQDALDKAEAATASLQTEVDDAAPLDLPSFDDPAAANGAAGLALLNDVDLQVKVELGRTTMYVEDVLRLNENSVVELDKAAGEPVDIYVNDRHVARGEVLVLDDNFCVRISEILSDASAPRGEAAPET